MSVSRSLTFLGTPWSVALSIVAVLATAVLLFHRLAPKRLSQSMGMLELLRLALVGLSRGAAEPAGVDRRVSARGEAGDRRAVGRFGQHGYAGRRLRERTSANRPSPAEAIAGWPRFDLEETAAADERRDPAVLAEPKPGHGTDLNDPLARPQRIQNLRGVVLASDGDWNEGQPPVLAAAALRMRGVPVFAVPVGSRSRLPDVELLSLDLPTFGVAGKSVRVPFSIESSLPREFTTTVSMRFFRRRRGDQGSEDRRR